MQAYTTGASLLLTMCICLLCFSNECLAEVLNDNVLLVPPLSLPLPLPDTGAAASARCGPLKAGRSAQW